MNLKITRTILVVTALASPGFGAEEPERNPPPTEPKRSTVNVQTLLEEGLAAGEFPAGLVVRVNSCEGILREELAGKAIPPSRVEAWEFSAKRVSRIERSDDPKTAATEQSSRPFDSKVICRDLLNGKALEIPANKGTGKPIVMLESPYERGSRSIEVLWKGESVLELRETNGPFFMAYPETDARAFGKLYERLSGHARNAFAAE